jgi:hypothetical protein
MKTNAYEKIIIDTAIIDVAEQVRRRKNKEKKRKEKKKSKEEKNSMNK